MPTAQSKAAPLGKYGKLSPGIQPVGPIDDWAPEEHSMLTPKPSPREQLPYDGLYRVHTPREGFESQLKSDVNDKSECQHFDLFNFLGCHLESLGQMLDAYSRTQYLEPETKSRIQKDIYGAITSRHGAYGMAMMTEPRMPSRPREQTQVTACGPAAGSLDANIVRCRPVVRSEWDVTPESDGLVAEEPKPPAHGEACEKKEAKRVFLSIWEDERTLQRHTKVDNSWERQLRTSSAPSAYRYSDQMRNSLAAFPAVRLSKDSRFSLAGNGELRLTKAQRKTTMMSHRSRRTLDPVMSQKFAAAHAGLAKSKTWQGADSQEIKSISASDTVDFFVAFVILLNAFIMGLSSDLEWDGWQFVEYAFTGFFLCEMLGKLCLQGCRTYFCGRDKFWNLFDFTLVQVSLVDCGLTIVLTSTSGGSVDLGKLVIIKMARLGRLGRLVRLLRFRFFKELKLMIHGVFAGLRVLFWAVVLFLSFIYFLAIAMVRIVADESSAEVNPAIEESFGKVPWGMLTLFRCFTDGCTAHDGSPLQVHLFDELGAAFLITYMLTVLFVSIGLFNLIMAIFVDNVMESKRLQKQEERGVNRDKVERELRRVVSHCASRLGIAEMCSQPGEPLKKQSEDHLDAGEARRIRNSLKPNTLNSVAIGLQHVFGCFTARGLSSKKPEDEKGAVSILPDDQIMITREFFCELIAQPDMELILEHLDIDSTTRDELFDVLDADMSGELDLDELVDGLMSLRGPTEKKDCVGTLLCARVTQQMLKNLHLEIKDDRSRLWSEQQMMKRQLHALLVRQNGQGSGI